MKRENLEFAIEIDGKIDTAKANFAACEKGLQGRPESKMNVGAYWLKVPDELVKPILNQIKSAYEAEIAELESELERL